MKNPFNKKHISIFENFFNQKKREQKEMIISILITKMISINTNPSYEYDLE